MTRGNTPNLVLKRMQGHFLNIPPLEKKKTERLKLRLKTTLRSLYKKENLKPEIKPMTENLRDDLY